MALFPRMSSFHAPTRTYREEFSPFLSLFNDTFNELQRLSDNLPTTATSFAPKFDVKETNKTYELQGELPGIEQKNLTIELSDDHTLTVKGHTEHTREEGSRPSEQRTENHTAGPANNQSTEVTTTGSKDVAKQTAQQQTYWVSERSVGEFSRSFSFPQRVSQDAVKASLKNGILSVLVPKLGKQNTSRKIEVESE